MPKNLPPIVSDAAGQPEMLRFRTTTGHVAGYVDVDFETNGGDDWLIVWSTPSGGENPNDAHWVRVDSIHVVSWDDPSLS